VNATTDGGDDEGAVGQAHAAAIAAPSTSADRERSIVRIAPGKGWASGFPELWENREVLYFLVVRNLKVRYRQAALGATWAVLQPLLLMVVFALVIQRVLRVDSGDVPYALFAFSALVPWNLFSQSITQGAESLVRDQNLIAKVYVPRLALPLSVVGALLVDFLIAFVILAAMMVVYGTYPSPSAVALVPLLTLVAIAASAAVAIGLSALLALYRDVRSIVPFVAQVWLFATPVAYSSELVPDEWKIVYALNPMVGVVEGFRWTLVGGEAPPPSMLVASLAVTALLLWASLAYFRRVDHTFADVI